MNFIRVWKYFKKVVLSFCVFTVFQHTGYTQSIAPATKGQNYTPASPNVSQFQKYGDIPVNYSSGIPSISIPVWNIEMNNFNWPITLNYHSIGVQVAEVAGNVGLGWTINATGIVSAKVIGGNDLVNPNYGNISKRYLQTGGYSSAFGGCVLYNQTDHELAGILADPSSNSLPDLFYVNSPVLNNKFFMRGDSGFSMPRSNLKIKFNYLQNSIQQSNFFIVDEYGNQYTFNKYGGNGIVSSCTNSFDLIMPSYSFHLSKIITYYGEEINFYYTSEGYSYPMPEKEVKYEKMSTSCPDCIGYNLLDVDCQNLYSADEQRLDSITTTTGQTIHFTYSARSDVVGTTKLDRIKIYSSNVFGRRLIAEKQLVNDYFGSGSQPTGLRLRLKELKSISGSDQTDIHKFTYDPTALPDRLSFATDYFNYYNGQNSNTTFLMPSANRTTNGTYAKAGILTKIEYPTGGATEFEYEYNIKIGGNRIKFIRDYSSLGIAKQREYVYNTYNIMPPSFEEEFANYYRKESPVIQCNAVFNGSCYVIVQCNFKRISSTPVTNIYSQFVSYSRYPYVKEIVQSSSGNSGYTEFLYDRPKTISGAYNVTDIIGIDFQLTERSIYENYNGVPRIISKEENIYRVPNDQLSYYAEATDSRQKNSWGIAVTINRPELTGHCVNQQGQTHSQYCYPADFLQGHFKLVSTPLLQNSNKATSYSYPGGIQKTHVRINNYLYEDFANTGFTNVSTNQSDGQVTSQKYIYPTMYTTFSGLTTDENSALQQMVQSNNIAVPFYSQTELNATITNKSFKSYKLNAGKSYLYSIKNYPTGGSTFSQLNYKIRDNKGNIQEVEEPNGLSSSILYDPQTNLTMAYVNNATVNNIAYTSFEYLYHGNWAGVNMSQIVKNGQSLTGKNYYASSNFNISKAGLTTSTQYLVTYWSTNSSAYTITGTISGWPKMIRTVTINGQTWNCFEHKVTSQSTLSVTGSGLIDELRLYPVNSQMNTYCYETLVGVISSCDTKNSISYYEYDNFQRLILVRDDNKNILKKICYGLQGQVENCDVYYNDPQSGTFTKSCSAGFTGSSVLYTVPARSYSAPTLASANQLALNDVSLNGQSYANANGTCNINVRGYNYKSSPYNVRFTNNNTGIATIFYLPAYTYSQISLGSLPSGVYTVLFYPAGSPVTCTFDVNGASYYGTGATFYNVSVGSYCNVAMY
jgi:hypothetical protein